MERIKSKKQSAPVVDNGYAGGGGGHGVVISTLWSQSKPGERAEQRRYYVGRVQICYAEVYPGGACIGHLIDSQAPPRGEHFANETDMHAWMKDLLTAKP